MVSLVSAEFAVLDVKGDFANLRAKPSIKAKVITKVKDGEILWHPDMEVKNGWHDVAVQRKGEWVHGYMHDSVLRVLGHESTYKAKDFKFSHESKPFKKTGRKLEWNKDGRLIKIDGLPVYCLLYTSDAADD